MALSVNERQEEFQKTLLMSLLPYPKDMKVKELSEKTLEIIGKLLLSFQKIFDISTDKDEQVQFAFIIKQLQSFNEEIKENEFAVYCIFSYVAALCQGIKVYQREFKLI